MKLITIKKRQYEIPSCWDELTGEQLLQVMTCLHLEDRPAEGQLLQLLRILTGMNNFRFLQAPIHELEEFLYLVVFLFQPDQPFTKNHLPVIAFHDKEFYGPSDGLGNLRMKEFALAQHAYSQWCASDRKDLTQLNELVAVLYRPAKKNYNKERNPDGDIRVSFNQDMCSWRAKYIIANWPIEKKLAIATWFDGCNRRFVSLYSDVYDGGGDPAQYGLVSLMMTVAEGGVFGTFAQVEEQFVDTVHMHLSDQVVKARRIEADLKSTS